MICQISAMNLRKTLGHVLNRVSLKHEVMIVCRAEKPIAVLIDIDTFYQKFSPTLSTRSLQDFSNSMHLDLSEYQFNREDANAR
jgi:prevent-host-death family protein